MANREASAKGGRVRAERMTARQRSDAARLAAEARWQREVTPVDWVALFTTLKEGVIEKWGSQPHLLRNVETLKAAMCDGEKENR